VVRQKLMAVMATHLTRVLATNVYTPTATADRMNVTNVRIANACVAVNVSEKHTCTYRYYFNSV